MPDVPATWSITYSDGAANRYRFSGDGAQASFAYHPITPEQSSTGMYSGGDPRSGTLDARTAEALWQRVRALEGSTELHIESRNKGTGHFQVTDPTGTRDFIIERGAQLLAFDEFVGALGAK